MINRLEWVNHDSSCDSDSSEDSLTAADLAVLEDHELFCPEKMTHQIPTHLSFVHQNMTVTLIQQ